MRARVDRVVRVARTFLDEKSINALIIFISAHARFIVFRHARQAHARLGCKKGLARSRHQGLKRE
jgi:hypothetical protein